MTWYKSKTKWGTIILAAAQAAKVLVPPEYSELLQLAEAAGMGLAGFGIRDALNKKEISLIR